MSNSCDRSEVENLFVCREHDGATRGRDVVVSFFEHCDLKSGIWRELQVRTGGNSLTSSYVNLDREPLFYKNTKQVIATTFRITEDQQQSLIIIDPTLAPTSISG